MVPKGLLQALYLLAAVLAACLGQLILRSRPSGAEMRSSVLYLAASLLCYGASFGITAMVLPGMNRKLAVLTLSTQYPILYALFAFKDSARLSLPSMLGISLGYGIVALSMLKT